MNSGITRRTFLKISGGTVLGGLASAAGIGALTHGAWAESPSMKPDRVVPTFCELCFWKCGVLAYVKDDKVYKIEGNPKHPLSNGMLCPRGAGAVGSPTTRTGCGSRCCGRRPSPARRGAR
jgi:thiosulfate reductase / polysulfide reductase chain A